jgi:CubicO group peptidase (beta-lactamase class C family)
MAQDGRLPRLEGESQGISSRSILGFLKAADERIDSFHGFMLLRHGAVVAEGSWRPYRLESPHMLFSLSKSFTSTAVGMAVADGLLSVDDTLLSLFPREAPKHPSKNLEAMRVRHLLSMNSGHEADTTDRIMRERDPVKAFLGLPVEREPGSHFAYNSGASFMLSAIVQKLTGERLSKFLEPRLFAPLGIKGAAWDGHPCGIDFGGWGLSVKVEDIARFGQLYLQKGLWEGRRILPESWVEGASSAQSDNSAPINPDLESDWQQGYGYQFWRCRHGFYRGDGAFGQLCVIMPELDAVLAVVSGLSDMQAALNLVWEHLAPGMSDSPLPTDPEAVAELGRFVGGLSLRPPAPSSSGATSVSPGSVYRFEANRAGLDSLAFDFGAEALELRYRITRKKAAGNGLTGPLRHPRGSGARELRCGYGEWIDGVSYLDGEGPKKAACAGAWTAPDTFTMRLCAHETPFVTSIAFRFEGDRLRVEAGVNVGFGPTKYPPIEGRA